MSRLWWFHCPLCDKEYGRYARRYIAVGEAVEHMTAHAAAAC